MTVFGPTKSVTVHSFFQIDLRVFKIPGVLQIFHNYGESMIVSAIFHWQLDRKKSVACLHFDREMGVIFGGHGCFSFFRKKMNPHML